MQHECPDESRFAVGGPRGNSLGVCCGLEACNFGHTCSLDDSPPRPEELERLPAPAAACASPDWATHVGACGCLKEPAWLRPVLPFADAAPLGEPPPFDDASEAQPTQEPERLPPGRRRLGGRSFGSYAEFIGPCTALAVVVLTPVTFGYAVGISEGRGFVRQCDVPAREQDGDFAFVITNAVAMLAIAPPAVLVLAMAASRHLQLVALYVWILWLVKPVALLYSISKCASQQTGVLERLALPLYNTVFRILSVASKVLYLILLLQRLQALEASSFRNLGARTFRCLLKLLTMKSLMVAVLGVPLFFLDDVPLFMSVMIGASVWIMMVLMVIVMAAAVRVARASRTSLLDVSVALRGRVAEEALRASRAMVMQVAGMVVFSATTVVRILAWNALQQTLWPVPASELKAALGPIRVGAHVITLVDDLGNVFSALALGGCLSGALRATWNGQAGQRQRRRRWAESAAAWRSSQDGAGALWKEKVESMGMRGISLEELLRFYRGLGSKCMEHYDPARHTTADVVWQAIIPLTCESRSALSTVLMQGKHSRPHRMVTHNWGSRFHDLVAAIVADALNEPTYAMVSYLLQHDAGRLEQWARDAGKHAQVYWVCAFCVNQHLSICGAPAALRPVDAVTGSTPPACACGLAKALNETEPAAPDGRSIPCEMNKFDCMIRFLSATDPHFEHVIAVDADFELFSRAWCVSEIAAANAMGMKQHLKLNSAEALARHEAAMKSLRIQDMRASREEDKQAILAGIPDVEDFNRHLQSLLFRDLIPVWSDLDASEQMFRAGRLIRWQGVVKDRCSRGLWMAADA